MVEILEPQFPIVVVKWLDHMTEDDWCKADTLTKIPPTMMTCGWLVYEDDVILNLVQCVEYGGDGEMCNQFLILKSCITERINIGE